MTAVNISGYKKGGGGQHIPTEASDSLRSKASVRILDLISEGEIEGVIGDAKGIYLDETPLQNADGTFNFNGVKVDLRKGTQAQTYIEGFPSVENEVLVNVKATTSAPVVRNITTPNLNAVRVRVMVPALSYQNLSNGDTTGSSVQYALDIQNNGGGFVPAEVGFGWSTGYTTVTSPSQQQTTRDSSQIKGTLTATPNASPTVVLLEWKKTTDAVWQSGAVMSLRGTGILAGKTAQQVGAVSFTSDALALRPFEFTTPVLPSALYDVRIRVVSGSGSITMSNVSVYSASGVVTISGKSSGPYQRSHRIPLTGNGPWDLRMRRITLDNALSNIRNDIYLDSYTEIIDAKLRYPNSAIAGIQCDASQFNSVPTRGYLTKLLRVQIPSNYNPTTRAYTGVWNGSFVIGWTDNPAWCFYDLLTNTRYGLGQYLSAAEIDKWALYTIGKYCDELVPDGFGGTEPRFRLNVYLQTREEAYKVMNDLASCFRGMLYYGAGVTAVQDSPADPVYLYTPANVLDGMFNYSGTSLAARHTVALVAWNDPADRYRQKVEYVEDAEGIALYGVEETEITAVGCTSRGQAHRAGRWLLLSERLLTDTVTFRVGLDGTVARPGQIVKIADPAKATVRLGGRLLSGTTTVLGLDSQVTLGAFVYTLSVMLPDGTVEARTVTTGVGPTSSLTVSAAYSAVPSPGAVWVLESSQVSALTYRVLIVTETEKNVYTIVALLHNPGLYAAVETGVQLEAVTGTLQLPLPIAPATVLVDSSYYTQAGTSKIRMSLTWDRSTTVSLYRVSYRRSGNNWTTLPDTGQALVEVDDVLPGDYEFEVVAFDSAGRRSRSTFGSGTVDEKGDPPGDVTGFVAVQSGSLVLLTWEQVADLDLAGYEVRYQTLTDLPNWDAAEDLTKTTRGTQVTTAKIPPGDWTLLIRAVDATGNLSLNAAIANVTVTSDQILFSDNQQYPDWLNLNQINDLFWSDDANLMWNVSSSALMWTAGNFVKHWSGGLVIDSQVLASDGANGGWDTFDIAVPSPYPTATYDTSEIDLGVDGNTRVFITASVDLLPGETGAVSTPTSLDRKQTGGAYQGFSPWVSGQVATRFVRGRVVLTSANGVPVLRTFSVSADVPLRINSYANIAVPVGGLLVTFDPPYRRVPSVSGNAIGAGLTVSPSSPSTTSVRLSVYNGPVDVGGTINYTVSGI